MSEAESRSRSDKLKEELKAAMARASSRRRERKPIDGADGPEASSVGSNGNAPKTTPTPAKRYGGTTTRKEGTSRAPAKKKKKRPVKRESTPRPDLPKAATAPGKGDLSVPREVDIWPGASDTVTMEGRDEKTGLTPFQVTIVKIVEKYGPIHIKNILHMIWTEAQVKQNLNKAKRFNCMRAVRNAVRTPVNAGMITRVDNKGVYEFVQWGSVRRRRKG